MIQTNFSFSDTITGYVNNTNLEKELFSILTSDGREFEIKLTSTTFAEVVRNLGEAYSDCSSHMKEMLVKGRHVFVYGIFIPEENMPIEAKHIIFSGRSEKDFVFEKQDWWIKQIRQLADFYLKAQFGDGEIDFRNYRTMLDLYGNKIDSTTQVADTISRLVYGFASAYMLTGEERYLEVAEKGTIYLREHFRAVDTTEDICYWYHAVDFSVKSGKKILSSNNVEISGMRSGLGSVKERKMLSSELGDDNDSIPAYEQIYALTGPTQTYRVTGDPLIRQDIDKTLNLLNKFFKDYEKGGYFSHIDPITFSSKSESLGPNRARKNWNSVGDHAPAYLINLYLATGEETYAKMLIDTADTITEHFQDYERCAFVQEKFHEDWSHDNTWGWQQNRGVVGHNLKIAWNLMRIHNLHKDEKYIAFSKKIAELMPLHGGDPQRGGWYDVVERILEENQKIHRYAWHDRKAWWQQEQGILAYLIMYGILKDSVYLKHARESSAFYNAFFLDHDSGGVYFNVLANGLPYLLGTERMKGSHSMSGYHSFELCFLASVYSNLLILKQPMEFFFKPVPHSFKDNLLHVSPDILPEDSVKIDSVTINGVDYTNFNSSNLTVTLPDSTEPLNVKVIIVPTTTLDHFSIISQTDGDTVYVILSGEFDARAVPHFRKEFENLMGAKNIALKLKDLQYLSPEGVRALIFEKQKLNIETNLIVIGAKDQVLDILNKEGFSEEVEFQKE